VDSHARRIAGGRRDAREGGAALLRHVAFVAHASIRGSERSVPESAVSALDHADCAVLRGVTIGEPIRLCDDQCDGKGRSVGVTVATTA
jgi:hypothetical protein